MSELVFLFGLVALVVTALGGLLIWSHISWMRHTQVLVNKVMSQNYRDYAVGVARETNEKKPPKVQEAVPEDMRALQEFTFN